MAVLCALGLGYFTYRHFTEETRVLKVLFYIAADGKMMAVEVTTGPKFEAGLKK